MPPLLVTDTSCTLLHDDDEDDDALVLADDSSEDDDDVEEEEEPLPLPVSPDHPFEFDRVLHRLERTLHIDHDVGQMDVWEDEETGMMRYVIETRSNSSGMRKMIFSSGDITYRRRDFVYEEGRIVDVFWGGTDGVCESCQHVSGLHHPVWYKESNRMYPEMDYGEDRVLETLPNYTWCSEHRIVKSHIRAMRPLTVLQKHNALPVTIGEAVRRQQIHEELMRDIRDEAIIVLTDTLAAHGVDMPSSVQSMRRKEMVMRDLFTRCICGKNKRKARLWACQRRYGPELREITSLSVSEETMRERWVETLGEEMRDRPMSSRECIVQIPCACLCACGHRNSNYAASSSSTH